MLTENEILRKTCPGYKTFLEAGGELEEEIKINLAFITMEEELMELRPVGPPKSTYRYLGTFVPHQFYL